MTAPILPPGIVFMSNRPAFVATPRKIGGRPVALGGLLIGLASAPALADAVTYTGTLGGEAIVLELTELEDGPLLGRYSYQSNGANIPLHPLSASPTDIVLAQEAPCTIALCVRPDDNLVLDPPLAGQFSLHFSPDNTKLTGTWRVSSTASSELPVELTRFGQRAYDRDSVFPYGSFLWMSYDDAPIAPETSPYDYAKMQVALTEGPLQPLGGATWHEVTDPRTKFATPRIVSLPGGGDVAPINASLEQRHWATNFSGFECLSMDYLSGGWMPAPFGNGATTLGGIDQDRIAIDYLSDTVMTVHQSSHRSCGGGEPYDYVNVYTYDVRAGRALDLSQIFSAWDAATNNPTPPLIDWFTSAYRKGPRYDADFEDGCLASDYLTEALDVSFAEGDVATFMVGDVADVTCTGPVVSVPLADIKTLLSDKAAEYFPSL